MEKITITYNNEKKDFQKNITYYEISKGFNLDKNILGAKIGNEVFSLSEVVKEDVTVDFIDLNDIIGNKIYKSGLEFIFEVALKEAFPDLEINYQHSVPRGFLGEIIGNKTTYLVNPSPYKKQNATIIIVDIKKFTIALVTIEIGSISLGKYTFLTILPLAIIV